MLTEPRMNSEVHDGEEAMKELLSEPGGFERYARDKMPEFIQVKRDYEGFVRDVIMVTDVDQEDLQRVDEEVFVTYSMDVKGAAGYIAREGQTPTMQVKGKTVSVGFFQIVTPELKIHQYDIDTEPYDLMRRAQEKSGQEIARLEDARFLQVVNKLVESEESGGTQVVTSESPDLTKDALLEVKQIFSRNDVAFGAYLMNPATYDTMLKWGEDDFDDVTQREVLQSGQLPTIWNGIKLATGIMVDERFVYGLAPDRVLGRMPILRDVTTAVDTDISDQSKSLVAYEYIGMYIHSHLAVARLELGAVAG